MAGGGAPGVIVSRVQGCTGQCVTTAASTLLGVNDSNPLRPAEMQGATGHQSTGGPVVTSSSFPKAAGGLGRDRSGTGPQLVGAPPSASSPHDSQFTGAQNLG